MPRWDADAQKRAVTPNSKIMSVDEITHVVTHLLAGELQLFIQAKNFGTIQFDAPAPTPGETGEYTFSSGGVCTWLDVYPDTNTVVAGDKVQVIYDAATLSYSYELVPLPTNKASAMANDSSVTGASVKDALNTLKAADASLQNNLNAEALARTGADDTLQDNIDAESLARSQADSTLQDNIDAEESSRIDADHTLQDNLNAETLARSQADNTLQNNLNAETLARSQADNTLQDNIDAETENREEADIVLQGNINTETAIREAADKALRTESFTPWAPSDGAPTPDIAIGTGKIYAFSEAGTCPFITGGSVVVEVGDWFEASRTGASTWIYTYIDVTKRKVDKTDVEQVRSQATNKVASSKLLDDELTALKNAVDANNQTWVGIVIDSANSCSEPAPKSTVVAYRATELKRTGNLYYHKFGNSRIFNAFRPAIVNRATKKVDYWLDKDDMTKKADGTASSPDWTTQNICIVVPNIFRAIVVNGTQYEYRFDIAPFDGAELWHEESAHSIGFATVDRTNSQLVSVVSNDVRFRGANNESAKDALPNTGLGKPATNITRTNFETYANNAGWETGNIKDRTLWHSLYALYFANTNSQLAFTETLTVEGYPQGGTGAGVTGWNSTRWSARNSYYPIDSIGLGTMEKGCTVGVKSVTCSDYYIGIISSVSANNLVATGQFATSAGWSASYIGYTVKNLQTLATATITGKTDDNTLTLSADIFQTEGQWFQIMGVSYSYEIPVFFGLENLYGEIWDWVSGVNIEKSADVANGGTGISSAYICTDFAKRAATITADYTKVGEIPRTDGYIKSLIPGWVVPLVTTGASDVSYMSDYGYCAGIPASGTTVYGLLFGRYAAAGALAGVRTSNAGNVPASAYSTFGARLRAKISH